MPSDFFPSIEIILENAFGSATQLDSIQMVGGGCINQAFKVETNRGTFFLKWNENGDNFFRNEERGLHLLRESGCISIPEVIGAGVADHRSYLLLEYIAPGYASKQFWDDFGRQMACLHQVSSKNECYGLDHNNEIGRLGQKNEWTKDWIEFFIQQRLEIQITLAYYHELVDKAFLERFRRIYSVLPTVLAQSPPSLLHGDLWSGNFLVGENSIPVLIDPAVYFGHREIELAFTQLFGGFDRRFYQSYQEVWPIEPEFGDRAALYNLYPLLVHVNLFGVSYLSGVEQTLRRFL